MARSGPEPRWREERHFMIAADAIGQIIEAVPDDYDVIGPVRRKWAVNLAPLDSTADLALDVRSVERPGYYRLEESRAALGQAKPMNSPKSFTHRPREIIYRAKSHGDGHWEYETPASPEIKQAFFGLHPCDINGMNILDRTFSGQWHDRQYDARRQSTIIVGVDCFNPTKNCFCSTFDTGPGLRGGFDVGLSHFGDEYLVTVATDAGAAIMSAVEVKPVKPAALASRREKLETARRQMSKAFDLKRAVDVLDENYDHPYWREPSARCLSCGNCINVCPTCYCYQISEKSNLAGTETARIRQWDACQHLEFAAVHGGNFRPSRDDRIKQWVNHKLNWTIDQYGRAGCVGCGRCITWCPAAIDITEPVWRLGGRGIKLGA